MDRGPGPGVRRGGGGEERSGEGELQVPEDLGAAGGSKGLRLRLRGRKGKDAIGEGWGAMLGRPLILASVILLCWHSPGCPGKSKGGKKSRPPNIPRASWRARLWTSKGEMCQVGELCGRETQNWEHYL